LNVKLISLTQSYIRDKENIRYLNPEEHIVYCARVSNPSNQLNLETADRLLSYCIRHEHWSVFEQVNMGLEITTSRAMSAQIIRHRSFVFQEFSQRYAEVSEFEPVELREQTDKNRQSSADVIQDPSLAQLVADHLNSSRNLYNHLIDHGAARETARGVLPMASRTTIFMTGNVRSWIHYIALRTKENTQKEHREIAMRAKEIFIENFPNISLALGWFINCNE
jgi:thymidylate synthase (FAD)